LNTDFQWNEHEGIRVVQGILHIGDKPVESYSIIDVLGKGKNGIVFLAFHKTLQRNDALKVWFSHVQGDKRDKVQQGIAEVQKLAAANKDFAIEIYNAWIEGMNVVATMEYIKGETLERFCGRVTDIGERIRMAYLYLHAIEQTTTPKTCHGDAHWNNVLLFTDERNKYNPVTKLKLCDFGTSTFRGKDSSESRHWDVVEEQILRLTKGFPDKEVALTSLKRFQEKISKSINVSKEDPGLFSPLEIARMHTAPLRDYLDYWDIYFRGIKTGQIIP
jgi:serine/threonine protein kinase